MSDPVDTDRVVEDIECARLVLVQLIDNPNTHPTDRVMLTLLVGHLDRAIRGLGEEPVEL